MGKGLHKVFSTIVKDISHELKLRIVVREDLQNKEMVGDTCSPTASMRNLKYFLADAAKHKARVHQLDFIEHSCRPKLRTECLLSWT